METLCNYKTICLVTSITVHFSLSFIYATTYYVSPLVLTRNIFLLKDLLSFLKGKPEFIQYYMNTFIPVISDKPPNNPCEVVRNNPHYMDVVTGAQKG